MLSTPMTFQKQRSEDYQIVEQALDYLGQHYIDQPSLEEIAAQVGMSEFHFQRVFTRWAGISPKRFLQYLTKEHARELLDRSASVMEAAYQSGLSSPGRLHDLFVTLDAVTPGEYKLHGAGMRVSYGFHPTPFGECMLAITERGICGLGFVQHGERGELVRDLLRRWRAADLREEPKKTAGFAESIFAGTARPGDPGLKLLLNGTNFQIKVWEALLQIPLGEVATYEEIARAIGKPQAARAVGRAVATNPISYIIPCHRVIRKMGVIGEYHWGAARKKAILGWELASAQERTRAEVEA